MRKLIRVLLPCVVIGYFYSVPARNAEAQAFPSKTIEVVTHVGPGGGADIFSRYVVDIINREKLLPQPMVVVNKPGGSGAIAQNYVAGKRGDPHTLLTIIHATFLNVPTVSGLDLGLEKFTPLALFGFDMNLVAVGQDSSYKNLKDVIDAAKRSPKSVTVAVGTMGATAHMLGYLIEKQTGAKFNFIAHKGGGEAVLAVLGGHVQVSMENPSELIEHVRAKKLRALAISSEKRSPFLPGVPTLKEQGLPLTLGLGRAFGAPAGIPKEAQTLLEATFEKAYRTPAWKDFSTKNMFDDVFMKGEVFKNYLISQQPVWRKFIHDAGLAKK